MPKCCNVRWKSGSKIVGTRGNDSSRIERYSSLNFLLTTLWVKHIFVRWEYSLPTLAQYCSKPTNSFTQSQSCPLYLFICPLQSLIASDFRSDDARLHANASHDADVNTREYLSEYIHTIRSLRPLYGLHLMHYWWCSLLAFHSPKWSLITVIKNIIYKQFLALLAWLIPDYYYKKHYMKTVDYMKTFPYLHLVLLFWNHVFTCVSVIRRKSANFFLCSEARYLWETKQSSRTAIWVDVKTITPN